MPAVVDCRSGPPTINILYVRGTDNQYIGMTSKSNPMMMMMMMMSYT